MAKRIASKKRTQKLSNNRIAQSFLSRSKKEQDRIRDLAFKEARQYPPIVGDTVRSEAFPDYLGKLIKIRDDGGALVDFDEIGVRIVPFSSCIDVDLALQFMFAQERGIPFSHIDVAAFQKWSREEGEKIEAREREKFFNKQTSVRRGRYLN